MTLADDASQFNYLVRYHPLRSLPSKPVSQLLCNRTYRITQLIDHCVNLRMGGDKGRR